MIFNFQFLFLCFLDLLLIFSYLGPCQILVQSNQLSMTFWEIMGKYEHGWVLDDLKKLLTLMGMITVLWLNRKYAFMDTY